MWSEHPDGEWRSILEARLLAGQSSVEIAYAFGTFPTSIDWYEKMFFDVRDRLDRRDYIIKVILGTAADREANSSGSTTDHQRDMTFKLFAYFGGPMVLDWIITGLIDRPAPGSLDQVEPWLDSAFESLLRRNSLIAQRTLDINRFTAMHLTEINARLTEARRQIEADGGTQTTFERNIQEVLTDIPWALGREGFDQLNEIERKYATTAFEPRVADAMRMSNGEEPERLSALASLTIRSP